MAEWNSTFSVFKKLSWKQTTNIIVSHQAMKMLPIRSIPMIRATNGRGGTLPERRSSWSKHDIVKNGLLSSRSVKNTTVCNVVNNDVAVNRHHLSSRRRFTSPRRSKSISTSIWTTEMSEVAAIFPQVNLLLIKAAMINVTLCTRTYRLHAQRRRLCEIFKVWQIWPHERSPWTAHGKLRVFIVKLIVNGQREKSARKEKDSRRYDQAKSEKKNSISRTKLIRRFSRSYHCQPSSWS